MTYRGGGGITRWEAGTFDLRKSVEETMPYIRMEADTNCEVQASEAIEVRMNRYLNRGVIWESIEYRMALADDGDVGTRLGCNPLMGEIADSLLIHSDLGLGVFYLNRLANAIEGNGMTNPDVSVTNPLTLDEFSGIAFIELERSADLIRFK